MNEFTRQLTHLLDLRVDTNYVGTDDFIRQNVNFKSANAWTLVFAIFIASVGLNVNSTAVIIGAMLISPLMGPIVGAGYALGINDFSLLKNSARNLLYAVLISLITSTVYFLVSPFSEVQTEILARTSPNFYDVVIAFFGGAAGIVAISRTERSNAIPGVAIATALMPPLCTAGFGIATLEWKFLVGALYLFVINSVFICLSTFIFVRYLRFKKVNYSNSAEQRKINRWIIGIAVSVVLPSLVTAWLLLAQSAFRLKANRFVEREINFKGTFLVDKKFNFDLQKSSIRLTFIGAKLKPNVLNDIEFKKRLYGLDQVKIQIDQVAIDEQVDLQMKQLGQKELPYKQRIADLEQKLKSMQDADSLVTNLTDEIRTFSEQVLRLQIEGNLALVTWKKTPKNTDKKTVEDFILVRTGRKELGFEHSVFLK